MSHYLGSALVACVDVQERVDNIFATGGAGEGVIYEPLPFLQFVASTSALEQRMIPGEGHLRNVQVIYDQFITEDEVSENVSNPSCAADSVRGNLSKLYQIDPTENLGVDEKITLDHFRYQCESNPQYFARVMAKLMNALDRKVATKTAVQAAALFGKWNENEIAYIDGVSVVDDELIVQTKNADGTIYPTTFEELQAALMVTLFPQDTFIVGGMALYQYFRKMQAGCCATQGLDLGEIQRLYGYAVAYDKRVVAALDNTESLAIRAGALQLVRWNQAGWNDNLEDVFRNASNYVQFVMTSPQTGIPYDVTIKDDCGVVNINMVATTKLFGAPEDLFHIGTDYEGITWVNKIKVTNP